MTIKIQWIRGSETVDWTTALTWFVMGIRGTGKSEFLEAMAEVYMSLDECVLDLFGSRDSEGLAWLRSDHTKDKSILLLHGENIKINSEAGYETRDTKKLTLQDFEDYDLIISVSGFYHNVDQEFTETARVTDLIYTRARSQGWDRLIYGIVREASNLFYSRLKVSLNQVMAKANMIYLIKEARHMGLTLGMDSQRFTSIDVDVRTPSDYTVLKAQGPYRLMRELDWLYSIIIPRKFQTMTPDEFVVVSKKANVGIGNFDEIPWHKKPRENIFANVGISVDYGQEIREGSWKGSYKTLGDRDHEKIIRLYMLGWGMNKISREVGRSSETIASHIHRHDEEVQMNGRCESCTKLESPYADRKIFGREVSGQRVKEKIDPEVISSAIDILAGRKDLPDRSLLEDSLTNLLKGLPSDERKKRLSQMRDIINSNHRGQN
jgi:hypothetical protein